MLRIGWSIKREAKGSHKILARAGFPDFVFAFHDRDEIGPRMLARFAKHTGPRGHVAAPGRGYFQFRRIEFSSKKFLAARSFGLTASISNTPGNDAHNVVTMDVLCQSSGRS